MMWSRLLWFLCIVEIMEAGIIEQPVSMTAFLNTTVTFYCSAFESAMFWVVDGTHSTNSSIVQRGIQTPSNTRMINGDTMARLIVLASASNNNTGIQCGVFTRHQGKILSDEVELKVQGLLDAPQDLRIEALGENTVILRWSPPFTLDVTDVDPDIFEYRVYILNSNTSNQEMKSIAPNVTEYQFVMNDECGVYEFSVSALNEVGEGKMSDPVVSICSGGTEDLLGESPPPSADVTSHPTGDMDSTVDYADNNNHSVTPSDAQNENENVMLIVIPVVVAGVLVVILTATVLFIILIKKRCTQAVDFDDSNIQMKRNCAYENTQIQCKIQVELNSAYGVI